MISDTNGLLFSFLEMGGSNFKTKIFSIDELFNIVFFKEGLFTEGAIIGLLNTSFDISDVCDFKGYFITQKQNSLLRDLTDLLVLKCLTLKILESIGF